MPLLFLSYHCRQNHNQYNFHPNQRITNRRGSWPDPRLGQQSGKKNPIITAISNTDRKYNLGRSSLPNRDRVHGGKKGESKKEQKDKSKK